MSGPKNPLNDGVLTVYEVIDAGLPGEMPKKAVRQKYRLRYDERVVGMNRYWVAKQASATIHMMVRCHRLDDVTTHDVVSLRDGKQYDIVQIQYPPDIFPRMMDLSLERRADKYDMTEQINAIGDVYTDFPQPPYKVGDVWYMPELTVDYWLNSGLTVDQVMALGITVDDRMGGNSYVCINSRETGSFTRSDWMITGSTDKVVEVPT